MGKNKFAFIMVMIILMSVILWFSVVKECYASGNGYWKFLGSQQRQDPQLTGTQKEDTNFTATSIQSTYSYDWQGKKYSSASNFSWKFGKSMKSLYPGDKIPVTGMLVYGRCTPGIGAGVNAFVSLYSELKTAEGFVPSGTHTNVIGLYLAPPGGQVSKTNNIEVWQGQKGQYMAIYCTSSIMRKASIKYIYEWVEGGAPPVQTHAGWEGNWNSEWGTVSFQVRGRSVTGTFAHKNGRLAGTLSPDGRTVSGRWGQSPSYKPPNDAGVFVFQLSADGRSFTGKWWYGFNTNKAADGVWSGNR